MLELTLYVVNKKKNSLIFRVYRELVFYANARTLASRTKPEYVSSPSPQLYSLWICTYTKAIFTTVPASNYDMSSYALALSIRCQWLWIKDCSVLYYYRYSYVWIIVQCFCICVFVGVLTIFNGKTCNSYSR